MERVVKPSVANVGKNQRGRNLIRELVGAYNGLAASHNALLAQVQEGSPDYSGIEEADTIRFEGEENAPS